MRPANHTAVLEPHRPYLGHLEGGFQVSVRWAEVPPLPEHHQDFFKDKFCHPIRFCLGSFAREDFFARHAQLFTVQPLSPVPETEPLSGFFAVSVGRIWGCRGSTCEGLW